MTQKITAELEVDGMPVSFRLVSPQSAPLNFVLKSSEHRRVWDSEFAAKAMTSVLNAGEAIVIEGSFETGIAPAPTALGIILKPQRIQDTAAKQLLGVDFITTPRIIAVVAPDSRREGIGRLLVQKLLEAAQAEGFRQVEVEAEKGNKGLFEDHLGFSQRPGAIRRHFSDVGQHTLYMLDKKL